MLPVSPHIKKTLFNIDCLCSRQLSLKKTGVHQDKGARPTARLMLRKIQSNWLQHKQVNLTFRFLQSNGQQLVPLRMPCCPSLARHLMGDKYTNRLHTELGSTRWFYQGTEGRCRGRWEPRSLAKWCNGSAKPLSPPLYPSVLTWPEHYLWGRIALDRQTWGCWHCSDPLAQSWHWWWTARRLHRWLSHPLKLASIDGTSGSPSLSPYILTR